MSIQLGTCAYTLSPHEKDSRTDPCIDWKPLEASSPSPAADYGRSESMDKRLSAQGKPSPTGESRRCHSTTQWGIKTEHCCLRDGHDGFHQTTGAAMASCLSWPDAAPPPPTSARARELAEKIITLVLEREPYRIVHPKVSALIESALSERGAPDLSKQEADRMIAELNEKCDALQAKMCGAIPLTPENAQELRGIQIELAKKFGCQSGGDPNHARGYCVPCINAQIAIDALQAARDSAVTETRRELIEWMDAMLESGDEVSLRGAREWFAQKSLYPATSQKGKP